MDISDLKPDPKNANRGTQRSLSLLDDSLREHGAGRSILIDKNGVIIAGNKTVERAKDIGLNEVTIVQTDGKKLVAVQRTDLDLENDPEARQMAYADNRVGQFLEWDTETIIDDIEAGIDLSFLFEDNEIEEFREELDLSVGLAMPRESNRKLGDKKKQIKPVLYADELSTFEAAILATGQTNRGRAIIEICEYYLKNNATGQFDI